MGIEDVIVGSDRLKEIRINNNSRSKSSRSRGEKHDPGASGDKARL